MMTVFLLLLSHSIMCERSCRVTQHRLRVSPVRHTAEDSRHDFDLSNSRLLSLRITGNDEELRELKLRLLKIRAGISGQG